MSEVIMITKNNSEQLSAFGEEMAKAYIDDFRRPPWFEVSRCIQDVCTVQSSRNEPFSCCDECGSELQPAYLSRDLQENWKYMINKEDAAIEVAVSAEGAPLRVTIARPTDVDELYARKYRDVPEMEPWLNQARPSGEFVWIEDTFANLAVSPKGNLSDRKRTLGLVALQYGGSVIATRTLAPAVVRATIRDVGVSTDLYIGASEVGVDQTLAARTYSTVPDNRTFISIEGMELL